MILEPTNFGGNLKNHLPETTVFLHIPKTAGTTLNRILERQYRRNEYYMVMENVSLNSGPLQHFINLPESKRASLRLLAGHMPYGVHQHLPAPTTYFTILRKPYERILSLYLHALRDPNHNLHDAISDLSLNEAIELQKNLAFDNFQTRLLSGTWNKVPFGVCDQEMLQKAKNNLRRYFSIVGIIDRFDEVLLLLQKRFNWRSVYYARQNVSRPHQRRPMVTAETIELINQNNQLDHELYQFASALCARQIKQEGMQFERKLKRFQVINRYLSYGYGLHLGIKKISVRSFLQKTLNYNWNI